MEYIIKNINRLNLKIAKVTGVILAAGKGTRMGCTKQLLPCGKHSLTGRVICSAEASILYRVIVILGYNSDKISKEIKVTRTRIIVNSNFGNGKSTSIAAGLMSLENSDAVMFILGDQPLITAKIINKLIKSYSVGKKNIIIPTYNNQKGNPVIFSNHFFSELMKLNGDVGGSRIIKYYKNYVLEVPFYSNAILFDLDTMKDYFEYNKIMNYKTLNMPDKS